MPESVSPHHRLLMAHSRLPARPNPIEVVPVNNPQENDLASRVRQARQVLAGSEVQPPDDPIDFGYQPGLLSPEQRIYLIALAVLLIIAIILLLVWSFGVASPVFFVLALGLIAGWFIF